MFGPWPVVVNELCSKDSIFARAFDALQKQRFGKKISCKEFALKLKQLMEESAIRNKK